MDAVQTRDAISGRVYDRADLESHAHSKSYTNDRRQIRNLHSWVIEFQAFIFTFCNCCHCFLMTTSVGAPLYVKKDLTTWTPSPELVLGKGKYLAMQGEKDLASLAERLGAKLPLLFGGNVTKSFKVTPIWRKRDFWFAFFLLLIQEHCKCHNLT